ncbi:MAG: N-acetyltransferase family protein [Salinigranum sp.]
MGRPRRFPEETAGPFEPPPVAFTDAEGREIEVCAHEGNDETREALVEMYLAFDPADRAQGIPPSKEGRIREWLDAILGEGCLNVIAWHGDRAIGHATLVPDGDAYELAIFVLQDYQGAGIGTTLIRALLGHGEEEDVERVWLSVERWNHPAMALYKKIGFETCGDESFELEMALRLG